jgi:hypothetical protein
LSLPPHNFQGIDKNSQVSRLYAQTNRKTTNMQDTFLLVHPLFMFYLVRGISRYINCRCNLMDCSLNIPFLLVFSCNKNTFLSSRINLELYYFYNSQLQLCDWYDRGMNQVVDWWFIFFLGGGGDTMCPRNWKWDHLKY